MEALNDNYQSALDEKQKMCDVMRIFTVLLDNGNGDKFGLHGLAPSIYMQQMSLTTEERTASSMKQEHRNQLIAGHAGVCFRATPKIVVFQQFSPGNTYCVPLSVTNITSSSQNLKMIRTKNSWFMLECKDATYQRKLAPGMSIVCDVKFFPEERRDYKYQAVFATGTETFTVPILAIGPRPLLDFPDSVEVPQTAVKILSVKRLFVRNVGDMPAVFSLTTNRPFTVHPQKGVLAEGETMEVTIHFLSDKTGCFQENLIVTYETGEIISLSLCGSAEQSAVRLERGSMRIEETYLGLTRSKTFTIHNRGDYVSKFRWVRYKRSFDMMKNLEVARKVDLEHYNICVPLLHELACQRIYADELTCLTDHTFPFRHPNYRLTPMEGEVWPHSTVDVTLIFEPDEVGVINGRAYLEVTGSEERIPLTLHGVCIGPLIRLNISCADLGCIFLCSNHYYEVICGNAGDIPGTLVYKARPTDFGGEILANPVQVKLQPGNFKSFNLCFSSNRTGDFTEKVDFIIKESLEMISLLIKGSVICPTLHFDKQNLDLGITALGFTTKHEVCLHNSSPVPVTFCLTITQDGTQQALTYEDFARFATKPSPVGNPKEFAVSPSEGVVAPHSFQRVKICYTPNVVRSSQTAVRADMWDSETEPVTLPIIFSSKVASLVVRPSEIFIRFCFINFPYMRSITVENKSDVEGYFYLPPQSVTTSSTVLYSFTSHQGHLRPNESKSISLKIVTTALGRQKVQLSLLAFGDRSPTLCCSLICNGQGPIITVQPTQLNWGEVRLLEKVESTITLVSDSPIPARFVARLHKTQSPWVVSPASGALGPNESLELKIGIYLRDTGNYSDTVEIEIMNSRVVTCSLTAVGIGTSIELNPNVMPVFDMGLLFRDQDISIPIMMVNKGTRHHRLTWTTAADFQVLQSSREDDVKRDKFAIDPYVTELPPDAESVVHCRIRWEINEPVSEQWFLYGQIKGQGKRQLLGSSIFKATFTKPNMLFSKRKLMFRYDPGAHETESDYLMETLFVTNQSGLDLKARVNIDSPFEVISEDDDGGLSKKDATILLRNDVKTRICISFNIQAIDSSNLYSRIFRRALTFDYETHRDKIECIAEVNHPNISLSPMGPVILSCEVGSTARESLTLVNTGHLPVRYSFEWLHAAGISTISHDTSQLQIRDSPIIRENGEEEREEAQRSGKGEEGEETINAIGYSFVREFAAESAALPAPAPSNDLSRSYGDNSHPQINFKEAATPAEDGEDPSVNSSPGCSAILVNTDNREQSALPNSVQVDECEIRDFISPMIEQYFIEDPEILAIGHSRILVADDEPEHCMEHLITAMLDVVPREGLVLPHSSQYVYLELDACQPIDVDTGIACQVEHGPTETIRIRASAGVIRYSIDKESIDFRWQPFGELCRETLTIVNRGAVGFTFGTNVASVDTRDRIEGTERSTADLSCLRVEPGCGFVNPMSEICLDVIYYVYMPGPINEQFDLEIANRAPISIHVNGYGSLLQAYLTVPRFEIFKRLPVHICYRAVGSLTDQFLDEVRGCIAVNRKRVSSIVDDDAHLQDCLRIPESERERLRASGWEVISLDEIMPTVTDVEMAVERLLTVEHLIENPYILAERNSAAIREKGISSLFVPEYIIDMGYVVVDTVGYHSAMLINYGPAPFDVRVRRERSSKSGWLKKPGLVVHFHSRKCLHVGESTPLNVTFRPTRSTYTEKRTDVEHAIYLEVSHGAAIPVLVRAVATYPVLTAHVSHLSFGQVAVGHCRLMPILLRNDGWVPCKWQATIRCEDSRRSKQETEPFFLRYSADTFLPGNEDVVNIYFKPQEAKCRTGQLRIKIDGSIFPVLVSMAGTGVEPELQVSENTLTFGTTLPYTLPEGKTFLVKNIGAYPVEVFWHNFDTSYLEEERMMRVMMHYYGVDEILLPPRHPGDKLSARVREFYQILSEEMTAILAARESGSERRGCETRLYDVKSSDTEELGWDEAEKGDADGGQDEVVGRGHNEGETTPIRRLEKTEMALPLRPLNGSLTQSLRHNAVSRSRIIREFSESNVRDSEETEALLHYYIDELRDKEDFSETMKDPVKEIFQDAEIVSPSSDHTEPLTRICIIFHGAPFTPYQQSACQVGKMIGIPALNIDDAITEVIALGNSSCSTKLREIIDRNYDDLISTWETYRKKESLGGLESNFGNVSPPRNSGRKVEEWDVSSRRTLVTPDANDADRVYVANIPGSTPVRDELPAKDYGYKSMQTMPKVYAEPDPLEDIRKIPRPDELKSMAPLDEYQYKIESVLLLQKIMTSAKIVEEKYPGRDPVNDKASGRSGSTRTKKLDTETAFLGISSDLIHEALRQRLAMHDFQAGFTVQTLNNIFVKSERDTLVMLLSIVGNVRCLLFVTFPNTLDTYLTKNEQFVMAEEMMATEELENELTRIEQMTRSEYDEISEDRKMLYAANTLPLKKTDSQRRHSIYSQRLAEAVKNRKASPFVKRASVTVPPCLSKTSKSKMTQSEITRSLPSSSNEPRTTKERQPTRTNDTGTTEEFGNKNVITETHRLPEDFEEIARLMDAYRTSLATLQPVLANWDPLASTYMVNESAGKNKTPKSASGMDTAGDQEMDGSKGIDVWYVAPVDPWTSEIYGKVASYLAEMDGIKAVPAPGGQSKTSLDCKLYSVSIRKAVRPSFLACEQSGVYALTSVSEVHAAGLESPMGTATGTLTPISQVAENIRPEEPPSSPTDLQFRRGSTIAATVVEDPVKPRWIIQPDEHCKFKVQFTPRSVGVYNDEYYLGVVGSTVTSRIRISGSADIPRLDMAPEIIFIKVKKSKLNDSDEPAYFIDEKTYDFGPIPLTNNARKTLHHRREAKFFFSNTSTIPATVSFFRMDNSDVYGIVPDVLNIDPGKSDILNVWAEVSEAGPSLERLLLCITNNPQVETIQLRSHGSKLEVELEGKVVAFEKVLLWRKVKRAIIVKNKSSLPLYWRLALGENGMDSQVTLHPVQGLVEPLAASNIECDYSAERVGVAVTTIVTFQAYLGEHDTEPVITDFITITGETYDVEVDLTNANPIDMKSVRVGEPATGTFAIRNRGPCEMGFIVEPETPASLGELRLNSPASFSIEDFRLEPASGSLPPGESVVIVVNFLPRAELTVSESPLFKCLLFDANNTSTAVVAEFPLLVSVRAHYVKFKIRPDLGLDFGPLSIFDKKTMYFDIENVGLFSFRYKISGSGIMKISPFDTRIPDTADKIKGRTEKTDKADAGLSSRRGDPAQSRKDNKTPLVTRATKSGGGQKILSALKVGPFALSRDEGEVEAGEVETIAVQCSPESVAIFEEEIQVFVSDTNTNDGKNAESVKLFANGCIPTIDLHDFDAIFRENLIVDSVDDFSCPRELGAHSLYGRREKCLYFRRVSLSGTHAARFKLHNSGLVSSEVTVKFDPELHDPGHGDGESDAFSIEPQKTRIAPLSTGIFTISFSPKLLGRYATAFTIVHELPPPLNSQAVSIKVCGEAAVPEVVLLEPTTPYTNDQILMNFGRVPVDEIGYRLMSFRNVGTVEAKVIAEISGDARGWLTFEPADQDVEGLCPCRQPRDHVVDERRVVCRLLPNEIACVNVRSAPSEAGKYEGRVDILTVGNPYEKIALVILGESYIEDVILEGLVLMENTCAPPLTGKRPTRSRKGSRDSQLKSPFVTSAESIGPIATYKIDYGCCSLHQSKRICFKIANKSSEHLFRFEWGTHPNVVFSPLVGHLNSRESKDIVATFSAVAPIVHTERTIHEQNQLECRVNEISRLPEEMNDIFWDDRRMKIPWDARGESSYSQKSGEGIGSRDQILKKFEEPIPEPDSRYVVPGSMNTIRVILCAAAAYSRYDCPIREINFKDVMMFQSCRYTFVVTNPGIVDMAYKWNLHMDTQYPTRLSDSALREVLWSLDNSCKPAGCRPKFRTSGGMLYPTNQPGYRKTSIVVSSGADNSEDTKLRRCNAEDASDSSGSTGSSNRCSAVSWVEPDQYLPFEIIPEAGILLPGNSIECTLVFSPLDVLDHQANLKCRIENLDPELPPLNLTVTARSLLPYCHFDIPQSDYLSGREYDTAAVLGRFGNDIAARKIDDIKVVEIQVVGVGETYVKKFSMINPTAEDYHFSWNERTVQDVGEISYFDCVMAEGVAEQGKRTEFTFTFLAKDVGVFESFWTLSIERYKLETMFLFVATVTEPSVYLIPGFLKMKPTVTGATARASITIFNREGIALSFGIIPESLHSDDPHAQRLAVAPMSGTLQPNGEEHLEIEFQPVSPGELEFSVCCRVDKLRNPLTAIVSTTAYGVQPWVVYKKGDGAGQQIHVGENNIIDCGNVQLHKALVLNIHVTNVGHSPFRYTWDLGDAGKGNNGDEDANRGGHQSAKCGGGFMAIVDKRQGHVTSQSSVICPVTITARRGSAVLNHRITLKIHRGPEYEIFLKAVSQDPSYLLNFNTYDFGPSYIRTGNDGLYSTKIHFTNNDETPCTLECKFESLPHLRVGHEHITGAVQGLSSVSMLVKFIPLERVCYRETISLLINSVLEEKITILGEGIEYKVRLIDLRHKLVDLGNVPVGKSVTRQVPIINKGRAPILLRFGLVKELPSFEGIYSKRDACEIRGDRPSVKRGQSLPPLAGYLEQTQISSIREDERSMVDLTIEPQDPTILHPNGKLDISVTYSPVRRARTFEENVGCQTHETILPLFILRGAAIGAEFFLDKTSLSFGTVVEGSSRSMKILLTNTGDIGGRFAWDVRKLMPHYDLVPHTGYCSPGMDMTFIVTFSPMRQSNSIVGQAIIDIENYGTMGLTTSGTCAALPEPTATLSLSTRVRQPTSTDITVSNTSADATWTLEPVVSGDYFTATDVLTVSPLRSNVCTVTYTPLSMTSEDQTHKGTIFFELPEGRGLLYVLAGTSLPPEPVAKIFREFPARTKYTELLPVSNWLRKLQRFFCLIELLDDARGSPVYNFLGNKTIDVPPGEQRDYRAVFNSYGEGDFRFRITFKNDDGEFHHYELHYRVTRPGIADTMELIATVRTVACHLLKLHNPLRGQVITYNFVSPHPYLTIPESSKLVNPESMVRKLIAGNRESVKIEFCPMVPLECRVELDANCAALGTFSYALNLRGTAAPPEKLVSVSAMLGSLTNFPITIRNCWKQAANFSIAIDDPSFSCVRNISIQGLGEADINVTYEPSRLQNVCATLTASSQIAGEYTFPIVGTAVLPKPQGPFTVTPDRAVLIPFKNIFNDTKTFDLHVDSPEIFRTEHLSETIQPKKTVKITVGLVPRNSSEDERGDIGGRIAGKLTVYPTEPALSHIRWIYYLRGASES